MPKTNYAYLDEEKYKAMLGIYIREQREDLHLSYSEISKQTQISSYRLKKIEAGQTLLKPNTLDSLKSCLYLDETYLEKIKEVARVAFIINLVKLLNEEKTQHEPHLHQ